MNSEIFENDEIEIDLLQLLRALKKRILLIIAAALVAGGGAGAYTRYVLTPQYTSTAMVYILSKETTLTSLADLQIGSQLTKDYRVIVTSRPVLEDVIKRMGLTFSYEQLYGMIAISNPSDTRILSISVRDSDPARAKEIVNTVARTSSEYIGDIMEMIPPKIIEEGVVPVHKSGPNGRKNVMTAAVLGALAVCALTVIEVLRNDTVRTEEDVEKYLGLSVLASVPLREGELLEDKDTETRKRLGAGKRNSSDNS